MLHVVTLLLSLAAAQEPLTIKGELKDIPAQGKDGPCLSCQGTANLPNGAVLVAYLYYDKVVSGRELFKDTPIVKNGKFSQDFAIYATRTFPGPYLARIVYDPVLQNLGGDEYPRTVVDMTLQVGTAQDVDREGKAIRDRLSGELRALMAMADQMKAKLDEYREKPQADREALQKTWHQESIEIRSRVAPRKNPEYFILRLDLLADSGFEELINIFLSASRCFVLNQRENMLEGLTRLRQSCDYWIGEISTPRLTDPSQMATLVEECRGLARKVLEKPDDPILPSRRRFLEVTGILDKSIPADYHEVILGVTSRATAFFNAAADKSPDLKRLHADLDGLLERFATMLRR